MSTTTIPSIPTASEVLGAFWRERNHQRAVLIHARARVSNYHDAEELVGTALMRALYPVAHGGFDVARYLALRSEKGEASANRLILAYLYTIISRLAADLLRRRGLPVGHPASLEQLSIQSQDGTRESVDPLETISDGRMLDPAEIVVEREELAEVLARVAALTPRLQTALLLAAQGYSQDEIMTALGVTKSAVKSRVCRAREELGAR